MYSLIYLYPWYNINIILLIPKIVILMIQKVKIKKKVQKIVDIDVFAPKTQFILGTLYSIDQ